jgi:DNA-directed RNA polymerase specialized sigma24 family protein
MSGRAIASPPSDPPGYDRWADEYYPELLDLAAGYLPDGLKQSPLPDQALADAHAEQRRLLPGSATRPLGALLKEYVGRRVAQFRNEILSIALRRMGWHPAMNRVIEEVPQEVILRFYEGRAVFSPDKGNFWGLVASVTVHVTQQLLEREMRTDDHIPVEADTPLVAGPEAADAPLPPLPELVERFRGALADAVDREIFDLRFVRGLEPAAIARTLDLKPMTVYQRIHRMKLRFLSLGLGGAH